MKTSTHSRTTFTIPGTDIKVELPFTPYGMDYREPLVRITDDQIILGYLAHDDDCESPLEDDYMGHIYEARRHGPTLRQYEQARGLGDFEEEGPDQYAVLLDVYEHGGISYSLSGSGMQCQFDTARGGAVWVPSEELREEIARRGAVYRKGDINEMRDGRYKVQTLNETLLQYSSDEHPFFAHWHEAFEYLQQAATTNLRDLDTAEHIAARELAKQAAEQYTAWRNGDCYGVVVVTYDKQGEELEQDAVWGFVGADHAWASLESDYFPKEEVPA